MTALQKRSHERLHRLTSRTVSALCLGSCLLVATFVRAQLGFVHGAAADIFSRASSRGASLLAGQTSMTRRGSRLTRQAVEEDLEGFIGKAASVFEDPMFEDGEQWRALTKIKVRAEPSIKAEQLEDRVVNEGDVFVVAEKRRAKVPTDGKHRMYLRIAGTRGWVFDLGAGGSWYGKAIATPVYDDEEEENPLSGIGDAFKGMMR
eukprot:TRINITY_DN38951_c0_g1_i1.p1 TRINITY_DN38951_c0_g1~~TRINITY_DN38951_c0_g1_i1.p1  ORF type:complete len:205 (-),score=51.18 TRINITY_DN38951_c0_g1_i1:3-617(-)